MGKNRKNKGESKKMHIDSSTVGGIVIGAIISRSAEMMLETSSSAIWQLAGVLLQRLLASAFQVLISLVAWQIKLGEWLCKKWYLPARWCLLVLSMLVIKYVYKWMSEKGSLKRRLAAQEKRLGKVVERGEKDRLNQKYVDTISKYRKWKAGWKNDFRRAILISGGALVFFLCLGGFRYFQPALRHSMEAGIAADDGITGIINEMWREPDNINRTGDMAISFILEDPDIVWELSSGQMQGVFYVTLDDAADNAEEVSAHLRAVSDADRVSNAGIRTEIENGVINRASRLEEDFLKDIEAARQYGVDGDDAKWNDTIPSSSTLDDIIEMRSGFWNDDMLSDRSSGELCFLLANSFQRYAREYAGQGGKIPTVVHCYALSILWAERAMSYADITEENEKLYYEYLRARYKDISDYLLQNMTNMSENEKKIYYEMQLKAYIIYDAM